jgi:hypothetical protein
MGKVKLSDLKVTKVRARIGQDDLVFRALSHLEIQERDEYAMFAASKRRRDIMTAGTIPHEVYSRSLEDSSDDALRLAITTLGTRALWREALREVKPKVYVLPEKATDAEKMQVLEQREKEPARLRDEQAEWVSTRMKKLVEKLEKATRDELLRTTREYQLNEQSNAEWSRAFQDFTIYASAFTDWECTQRVFESPEDVSRLPGEVDPSKHQLRDAMLDVYFDQVDKVREQDLQYFFSTDDLMESAPPSSLESARADSTP